MLRPHTCIALAVMLAASPSLAGESCHDGVKNGPESDVDCGGDCPPCALDKVCVSARDCVSGRCADGECAERVIAKGAPPPVGYEKRTAFTDPGATAREAGIVFLSVGYAGAYASALTLPGRLSWMYAPLLGPWLTLSQVEEPEFKGLIIADGAFQAAGALLVIGGVASGGAQIVRTESASVQVSPRIGTTMTGLDLFGRF